MNIEGKICRLRALEPEDLEAMYGWENDTAAWQVSGSVAPFSRHVLSRLIDEQAFDIYATRQMRLVIELREAEAVGTCGEVAGACGKAVGAVDLFEFDPQNRRAGVGIIISPEYRQKGLALDALLTLEGYVREVLHMHQLWCSVGANNAASLALFRRAGYAECGCRREWILTSSGAVDEILMQKIL